MTHVIGRRVQREGERGSQRGTREIRKNYRLVILNNWLKMWQLKTITLKAYIPVYFGSTRETLTYRMTTTACVVDEKLYHLSLSTWGWAVPVCYSTLQFISHSSNLICCLYLPSNVVYTPAREVIFLNCVIWAISNPEPRKLAGEGLSEGRWSQTFRRFQRAESFGL